MSDTDDRNSQAVEGRGRQGQGDPAARTTAILLQIEREARAAETPESLAYVIANRTRALIAYERAIFIGLSKSGRARVLSISNMAVVEKNAPMVVWLRDTLNVLAKDEIGLGATRSIEATDLPETDGEVMRDWWPGRGLWVPMRRGAEMPPHGGLLLQRSSGKWTEAERILAQSLADCFGHAWRALHPRKGPEGKPIRQVIGWAVALVVLASMAIPVPRSVVAPARIEPREPIIVAAPMEGVIEEILVRPNQRVGEGDVLFRFVSAELEANLDVAEQAVAAAEADLRRARQQAFGDPRSKAEVALKEATLDLKRIERDYGRYLASQIEVEAPAEGLAIFPDAAEWRGRPVQTGANVMTIADPGQVRIAIDIPVGDAIATDAGAEVSVFLDVDPLNPVRAVLEHAAYGATPTEDGVLAYRGVARLADGESPPRIGLHGTARIYGEPVPLGLFLFRRPISAVRRFLGV